MGIARACQIYLHELELRNTTRSTRRSYESLFRQLQEHAAGADLQLLEDLDREAIHAWRETWTAAFSTQRRWMHQLKAFWSFAAESGWIAESPMRGMRSPKSDARSTPPLSTHEMIQLLRASNDKPREQAMLLLLRYSGLAIGDAATLKRSALQSTGELVLRRAKSGELVTVLLPPHVADTLHGLPNSNPRYFFWTGKGQRETAAKYWRQRLATVATEAQVRAFHPHRLRNTFAVELLLTDVPVDDVSVLLGHSSVRTTELYYAPWNGARRKRLVALVNGSHQRDPILRDFRRWVK